VPSASVSVPGTNATSSKSCGWPGTLVVAMEAMLLMVTLVTALQEFMDNSLVVPMIVSMAPTVPLMARLACPLLTTMPRKGGMPQKVACVMLVLELVLPPTTGILVLLCGGGALVAGGENGPGMTTGDPLVETGGTLVETGGALVETGGALVETGGALVETGGALVETGGALVETGGELVKTGVPLV
jgi:hypothetical protein